MDEVRACMILVCECGHQGRDRGLMAVCLHHPAASSSCSKQLQIQHQQGQHDRHVVVSAMFTCHHVLLVLPSSCSCCVQLDTGSAQLPLP
jgi:hypothetical protein